MYEKSIICVKLGHKLTPLFESFIGVKQGDVFLSPNLFKLFINDLPDHHQTQSLLTNTELIALCMLMILSYFPILKKVYNTE